MEIYPRITATAKQCDGKACIRGHRLTVQHLLRLLAEGATTESLVREWPFLDEADIRAALSYAAHLAGERFVVADA